MDVTSLTVKTLALSHDLLQAEAESDEAHPPALLTDGLSNDTVLTPLVKVFLEYKGQHVLFQHLWLRSGLFKSTSLLHI